MGLNLGSIGKTVANVATGGLYGLGSDLLKSPAIPPAPDYAGAATAQGEANKAAQLATLQGSNPNIISPFGTQNVTWTKDPTTGNMIPNVSQGLSPELQGLFGDISSPLDFSGAPQTGNYDATRQSVIDAMMGRANEDYAKQTDQANSDLIARGIHPGTKAYADNQQMIERSRNDARSRAEIAGGDAATQAYGVDASRRQQAISEILAQRQAPLSELSTLKGISSFQPYTGATAAPAPVFGAATATGDYATDVYNQQVAIRNANLQGLMSLGSSAAKAGAR